MSCEAERLVRPWRGGGEDKEEEGEFVRLMSDCVARGWLYNAW